MPTEPPSPRPGRPRPDRPPRSQWGRERADRGRRRPLLDVDRIVEATLAIIDRESTEAVTMRRLAEELGVTASSLYVHVRSRKDVLALAHERVRDEVGPMNDTGDVRRDLRDHFARMQRVLAAHADIAVLDFAAVPSGIEGLAQLEQMLGRLVEAGVEPRRAVWGIDRLLLYTAADVYEGWLLSGQGGEDLDAWMARAGEELQAERYPYVSRLFGMMEATSSDERFLMGLDILLDGLLAEAPGAQAST